VILTQASSDSHASASPDHASSDDFWKPLLSGSTPVSAAVAALPPDVRDEVQRRLSERLSGESREGSISLQAEAFAVRGRTIRKLAQSR
jgi:hypothetical protein